MDDILKLAKDYSKERHLDLLPRCNNNILDKLDYIYDEFLVLIIDTVLLINNLYRNILIFFKQTHNCKEMI